MPVAANESRFFEAVLRCVADGVFKVDGNWRITSFNLAVEQITGVPAERAIGRHCSEVLHSSPCERACPIRENLETGSESTVLLAGPSGSGKDFLSPAPSTT